jgi:2-hydroxychromene-2-carboxylate isomerase
MNQPGQVRRRVEFFFDVGSPASYLAWTQLPALCAHAGAELVYRPMLLGAVFQATGNASPAAVPAKGAYTRGDFQRFARRYGVTLNHNPFFPIITLTLMRGAAGVQLHKSERFQDYLRAVFGAIWVEALDLNQSALVAATLERAGFDVEEILALTNRADVKAALRATTDEAVARGVFGAPTMFVGEEMFFGQDRLEFVREALESS